MNHSLEECELSTNPLDYCDPCGELTACTCLGSIVDTWEISSTGTTGDFAYRYQYRTGASDYFGYASSYREAMDAIAHSVVCGKEGK